MAKKQAYLSLGISILGFYSSSNRSLWQALGTERSFHLVPTKLATFSQSLQAGGHFPSIFLPPFFPPFFSPSLPPSLPYPSSIALIYMWLILGMEHGWASGLFNLYCLPVFCLEEGVSSEWLNILWILQISTQRNYWGLMKRRVAMTTVKTSFIYSRTGSFSLQ